ncbi:hypothetical protein RhiJN_09689 [Ceratobasidium sp. AG-Ba]|nr:hypothetical protein RhiJN_09689 [Ceratobasidium sp. AG-Ba]QRW10432.1 hypothetical protein RhiLY_09431 [Ceratobasidium sp. AG-Ba]
MSFHPGRAFISTTKNGEHVYLVPAGVPGLTLGWNTGPAHKHPPSFLESVGGDKYIIRYGEVVVGLNTENPNAPLQMNSEIQIWSITPAEPGWYHISLENDDKCWTPLADDKNYTRNVYLRASDGSPTQKWRIDNLRD